MRRSGEGGGSKNGHGQLGRVGLVVGVGHGAERGAEHERVCGLEGLGCVRGAS